MFFTFLCCKPYILKPIIITFPTQTGKVIAGLTYHVKHCAVLLLLLYTILDPKGHTLATCCIKWMTHKYEKGVLLLPI